jgi:hypothetical protein
MKREILIAKIIARFPEGKVFLYDAEYNLKDIDDLLKIASWIANNEGRTVYILPRISSIKDPNYDIIFPGLKSTIYYRKCPDFKVVNQRGDVCFIEYESFTRPFKPSNLSDMLRRGSLQSDSIIIDIRDSTIQSNHIRRQIMNKLRDPQFGRPITNVWSYDGKNLKKEW